MILDRVDETQRKAAKVVGLAYLVAILPALFAEFYVSGQLIVLDNAVETAQNIMAHERLFRLGIASNLGVFAVDAVLISGLYVVLQPVNRHLALLAIALRLIETAVLVVATLSDFDVLRVLSGADYLRAFDADRLHALARLSIGAHGAGYALGLLFTGLGSMVFCYLWFKSAYVPRAVAALGVVASFVLAARTFAVIIFPEVANVVTIAYYGGPLFIFEVTMGCWLLFKELRPGPLPLPHPGRPDGPAAETQSVQGVRK
jgi:hypothetical protein